MSTQRPDLAGIRQQIDGIDDQLLDLLRQRVQLVEQVAAAKAAGTTPAPAHEIVRPGREAEILRRLLARAEGALPRRLVVALWREMIAAFSQMQGVPLKAVVYDPDPVNGAYRAVARDYCGNAIPARLVTSAIAAVRAVSDGTATVAILPLPLEGEQEPWWPMLAGPEGRTPRIIARLPFARVAGEPEALVLSFASASDTGQDQSLVVVELRDDMSRGRLSDAFRTAGLVPLAIQVAMAKSGAELVLVDVQGYVAPQDQRLLALREHTGPAVAQIMTVGAYPLPYTGK